MLALLCPAVVSCIITTERFHQILCTIALDVTQLLLLSHGCLQGGDLLDWTNDHGIQEDAFIQRIEALSTMGYSVLLSNYRRYFKVANYLATFTRESIVIALGLPSLVVGPHSLQGLHAASQVLLLGVAEDCTWAYGELKRCPDARTRHRCSDCAIFC